MTDRRAGPRRLPAGQSLIARPGAITAVVVRAREAQNERVSAAFIQRGVEATGMSVATRVLGIIRSALSVQLVLTGVKGSGIFPSGERPLLVEPLGPTGQAPLTP